MKRRLQMNYITKNGKTGALSVQEPRADLDALTVQAVANTLAQAQVFSFGGSLVENFTGAKVIVTSTEDLY